MTPGKSGLRSEMGSWHTINAKFYVGKVVPDACMALWVHSVPYSSIYIKTDEKVHVCYVYVSTVRKRSTVKNVMNCTVQ